MAKEGHNNPPEMTVFSEYCNDLMTRGSSRSVERHALKDFNKKAEEHALDQDAEKTGQRPSKPL